MGRKDMLGYMACLVTGDMCGAVEHLGGGVWDGHEWPILDGLRIHLTAGCG